MNFKQIILLSFLCLGTLLAFAQACSPTLVGNLSLTDRWVRPSSGPNTAAYLTIKNSAWEPDRLLKVDCEDTTTVELHDHIEENGVMKMRPVPTIDIGKDPVVMKPGGLHIMLMGLKDSFKGKETVYLTLYFEKAGAVKAKFPVRPADQKPE